MSSVKTIVCIICLKKFALKETDSSNDNLSLINRSICVNLEDETLDAQNFNGTAKAQWNDPYIRFLLFVKGYFKLKTFTNRLLACAREAKNENGERTKLQTFCDSCGELVSDICRLYKELQTAQLLLLWKLSLVGELMKKSSGHATDDKTYKLWGARTSMAQQMNVIAVKPVDMFRKALQLKCVSAARKSKTKPIVRLHKGLVPDQWKFTFSDTQEALIRLIVLFTLASDHLSIPKHNPEANRKPVINLAKRRSGRPKKKQKIAQENTDQIQIVAVEYEAKKVEADNMTTTMMVNPSLVEGVDEEAPDNSENDSDWRDAASPTSVASILSENHDKSQYAEETYSKARRKNGCRNVVVIAEEDDEDAAASANSQKYQIGADDGYDENGEKIVPKSKESKSMSDHVHSAELQCPVETVGTDSVQCYQYTRVSGSLQVAMNLHSNNRTDLARKNNYRVRHRKTDSDQSLKSGKTEKLKCPKCPRQFEDGRGLIRHLKNFHGTSVEYPCKTCEMSFKRQRHLRDHQRKMHGPGNRGISSTCSKCSQVFPSRMEFHRHLKEKLHHGPPPNSSSCTKCSEVFPSRTELRWHMKKAHKLRRGMKPVQSTCLKCLEVFPSRTELWWHMKKTHILRRGIKPIQSTCSKCSEVLPSRQKLLLHMKIAHRPSDRPKFHTRGRPRVDLTELRGINEKFICEVDNCGKSFELASLLRKHLESVHEATEALKTIKCCYCRFRKKFSYRQTYEMHVRTAHQHHLFGMYKCDVETCKVEPFVSVNKLNEHLKSHLQEPDSGISAILFCDECKWGFTRPELRDLHQLCHIAPGNDGKIDCPKCSERFGPNVKHLQNHFNMKHGVELRPFKCDLCERTFLFERFFDHHRNYHITQNTMIKREWIKSSCPECSKVLPSEFKLWQHIATVHEIEKPEVEKNVQCSFCAKRYAYQQTHDLHLNTRHRRKLLSGFKCEFENCENEAFVTMEELNEHLTSHLGQSEKISFCEKCNWGFLREELRDLHQLDHIAAGADNRRLACPQCPRTFIRLHNLQCHFNKKHGLNLKRFQCDSDFCDKSFFTKQLLNEHKRCHRNFSKQFSSGDLKCDQCGVTFVDVCGLEAHLNSATGHLFCCVEPGCDLKFDTNRKLKIHITMKHLDSTQRDWICELCAARFTTKMGLQCHMRGNHVERKYTCEICGASFKRKDKLPLHMEQKHNPNRVKSCICSLCGKSYHSAIGLQYHTDSEHKTESEWHLKCPHCPRRFYRNMYLYRHLKTCKGSEGDAQ